MGRKEFLTNTLGKFKLLGQQRAIVDPEKHYLGLIPEEALRQVELWEETKTLVSLPS